MSTKQFIIVQTEYGPVKGIKKDTCLGLEYISFQGIPYMKAPEGKLKFTVNTC
jgi:carboxylesterase type B